MTKDQRGSSLLTSVSASPFAAAWAPSSCSRPLGQPLSKQPGLRALARPESLTVDSSCTMMASVAPHRLASVPVPARAGPAAPAFPRMARWDECWWRLRGDLGPRALLALLLVSWCHAWCVPHAAAAPPSSFPILSPAVLLNKWSSLSSFPSFARTCSTSTVNMRTTPSLTCGQGWGGLASGHAAVNEECRTPAATAYTYNRFGRALPITFPASEVRVDGVVLPRLTTVLPFCGTNDTCSVLSTATPYPVNVTRGMRASRTVGSVSHTTFPAVINTLGVGTGPLLPLPQGMETVCARKAPVVTAVPIPLSTSRLGCIALPLS